MSIVLTKLNNISQCCCENRVSFKNRSLLLVTVGLSLIMIQGAANLLFSSHEDMYKYEVRNYQEAYIRDDNKVVKINPNWISSFQSFIGNYIKRKFLLVFIIWPYSIMVLRKNRQKVIF